MTPERGYPRAVRTRDRPNVLLLRILLLRVLLVLLPIAVLVGFAFSDRLAGLLPQSWWFVAVFFCAAIAIGAWVEVRTGQWAVERQIYARALRRLGARLRPSQRRGE
jgi:RsiW-degrading membrane proteinase PrsW (M82 family)